MKHQMTSNDQLTAEDVARILRIGKNSVYQLARSGEISSFRIGRKLFFSPNDVELYRESRRANTGAATSNAAESGGRPFVVAGNDLAGDVLANYLSASGFAVIRSYRNSYTGLIDLYANRADVALAHLYDMKTNAYNVPYVQRMAPGMPVTVIRLLKRQQGFIVRKGNPKKLSTWSSLLNEGVVLANRKRGCGSRILLDEKLIAIEANPYTINGYDREFESAQAMANAIACGNADVGVGTEHASRQAAGLSFVALQDEWLDIAVAKTPRTESLVRRIKKLVVEEGFRGDLTSLSSQPVEVSGVIAYEC